MDGLLLKTIDFERLKTLLQGVVQRQKDILLTNITDTLSFRQSEGQKLYRWPDHEDISNRSTPRRTDRHLQSEE